MSFSPPQSHLRFAIGGDGQRTVTLDGQALFNVTHNRTVPFVIRTGDVTTRVLGTSFTVRHYAADATVKVVVAQGRVAVGSAILTSGDVAIANDDRRVAVQRDNRIADHLAWTEGHLVFSNVPLRDVIPDLERWYGIQIDVADPALLQRTVTTTLGPEASSEAVEIIAFAVRGTATFTGHRATLHAR